MYLENRASFLGQRLFDKTVVLSWDSLQIPAYICLLNCCAYHQHISIGSLAHMYFLMSEYKDDWTIGVKCMKISPILQPGVSVAHSYSILSNLVG